MKTKRLKIEASLLNQLGWADATYFFKILLLIHRMIKNELLLGKYIINAKLN